MQPKYIKLPNDVVKRRRYFEYNKLIYIHYPDYSKITKKDGSNYYLKVTFDTWNEHLIKGIYTIQEIAKYEPIVELYNTPHGVDEKIIYVYKGEE